MTSATPEIQKHVERLAKAQYLLYADGSKSLLVVLQALDAGGKDGVVRHVFTAMNPQGTLVSSFATPSVARRCAVDSCGDRRRQTQARSVGPAW